MIRVHEHNQFYTARARTGSAAAAHVLRYITAGVLIPLLFACGCATSPVKSETESARMKTPTHKWLPKEELDAISPVGVISAVQMPGPPLADPEKTEGSTVGGMAAGAVIGAGGGAMVGAIYGGMIGVFLYILDRMVSEMLFFGISESGKHITNGLMYGSAIGAGFGFIGGVVAGSPAKLAKLDSQPLRRTVESPFVGLSMEEAVCRDVVSYGLEQPGLTFEGLKKDDLVHFEKGVGFNGGNSGDIASILEITVLKAGMERTPPRYKLRTRARLIDAESGAPLVERYCEREGRSVPDTESEGTNNSIPSEEIAVHVRALAEDVVDTLFFMNTVSVRYRTELGVQNALMSRMKNYNFGLIGNKARVRDLRPTIEWVPFPGSDRGIPNEEYKKVPDIRNVTYDFRIWKMAGDYPVELVHEKRGISTPSHEPPEPLELNTQYSWTIRARFTLDGRHLVTTWTRPFIFTTPKR